MYIPSEINKNYFQIVRTDHNDCLKYQKSTDALVQLQSMCIKDYVFDSKQNGTNRATSTNFLLHSCEIKLCRDLKIYGNSLSL